YIGWASHCDIGPYHGWVMAYDATTLEQKGVWNSTPDGAWAGLWGSGAGLAADEDSSVYYATGNGTFDNDTGGRDFGDSIVKLAFSPSGQLRVADYFTPYNEAILEAVDADLGSGGVLLLPDQGPGSPHPHLLVQVGKEGTIYLIDRDRMGR